MRHKYLEKLGTDAVNVYTAGVFEDAPGEGRGSRWAAQRNTYGFDDRETWNLDSVFYAWLYEHIQMYLDIASKIVDLNFNKFEYDGKTYTQKEILECICEIIEYYFSEAYNDCEEKDQEYISNIGKMWAVVLPQMWW